MSVNTLSAVAGRRRAGDRDCASPIVSATSEHAGAAISTIDRSARSTRRSRRCSESASRSAPETLGGAARGRRRAGGRQAIRRRARRAHRRLAARLARRGARPRRRRDGFWSLTRAARSRSRRCRRSTSRSRSSTPPLAASPSPCRQARMRPGSPGVSQSRASTVSTGASRLTVDGENRRDARSPVTMSVDGRLDDFRPLVARRFPEGTTRS